MLYFRLTFLFSSSCFLDILGIMFPVSGLRCAVLLPLYRMRQFPLKVALAHAHSAIPTLGATTQKIGSTAHNALVSV